jgi:hypothetical protein
MICPRTKEGARRYCVPCGVKGIDVVAVELIDDDPLCAHCAREAKAQAKE